MQIDLEKKSIVVNPNALFRIRIRQQIKIRLPVLGKSSGSYRIGIEPYLFVLKNKQPSSLYIQIKCLIKQIFGWSLLPEFEITGKMYRTGIYLSPLSFILARSGSETIIPDPGKVP